MSDPYAPPGAPLAVDAPPTRRLRRPWIALALGLGALGLMAFTEGPDTPAALSGALGLFGCMALLIGAASGLFVAFTSPGATLLAKVGLILGPTLSGGFFAFVGALLTVMATFGFARGRQLRERGRVLLPALSPGEGWCRAPLDAPLPEAPPEGVAAAWRENARTEHASVAAFARLTQELMALGAPPQLIADAGRDAEEELRHTHLCFSLARAMDGQPLGPGAFPGARPGASGGAWRELALARLAVESLVDGALNEGVSARIVGRLAKGCEVEAVRGVLQEIARDEGRHALHGWEVLAWCLSEAPEAVGAALRGALGALPEGFADPLPEGARDGSWEPWGIPGQALAGEEYARTVARVRRRALAMLEGASLEA